MLKYPALFLYLCVMIDRASIDKVLETARIEEVVRDFVDLKRRGTSLVAKCPFHDEKTPSFHVSVAKGIFKCFSCGKGGDALSFVMEHEKYSYPDAIRYLAKKYNIELQETQSSAEVVEANQQRESLFIVSQFAAKFFQEQLLHSDEGKSVGLSYFKERGFSEAMIQKFELGYSPESWDALYKAATEAGHLPEYLIQTGLVIKNDQGKIYDRFRARVLFPIHNFTGRVIGFGGRTLKSDKSVPKYVNSPESDIYHKSNVLYGLFQAKKAIRAQDNCYLVEGYADVLAVHQAEIENVVASSGTSLTKEQIKLIHRFTENITILFDGDVAGIKAALRGLDLVLEEGMNVRIVSFPDGHDPDSYMHHIGPLAFKKHLEENRQDFIHFKAQILLQDAGNDPIKRAEVIAEMVQSVAKIPNGIQREGYTKESAELLGIQEQTLLTEVNKAHYKFAQQKSSQRNTTELPPSDLPPEAQNNEGLPHEAPLIPEAAEIFLKKEIQELEIIRLLLNYGTQTIKNKEGEELKVAETIVHTLEDIEFEDALCAKIFNHYKQEVEIEKIPQVQDFFKWNEPALNQLVVTCISTPYQLSENWKEKAGIYVNKEEDILYDAVIEALLHLKKYKVVKRMDQKLLELRNCSPEDEPIILDEYLKLKEAEMYFAAQLSIVISK